MKSGMLQCCQPKHCGNIHSSQVHCDLLCTSSHGHRGALLAVWCHWGDDGGAHLSSVGTSSCLLLKNLKRLSCLEASSPLPPTTLCEARNLAIWSRGWTNQQGKYIIKNNYKIKLEIHSECADICLGSCLIEHLTNPHLKKKSLSILVLRSKTLEC